MPGESETNRMLGPEQMVRVIEQRTIRAQKKEILNIYEEILLIIWKRIQPTLGRASVVAILERTVVVTAMAHPAVASVVVTGNGVVLDALREQSASMDRGALRHALNALTVNLLDVLATLTGDILVRPLVSKILGAAWE